MKTQVQKWGNSLALRIPKPFAEEIGLRRYSEVEVSVQDGRLIIEPIPDSAPELKALLAQVTEENLHHEISTGHAMGREAW